MLLIPLNVMDENLGIITIDYNGKDIGYECLYELLFHNSPGRIMQTARIIALQHHEKWNGKGYLGIKGTDIALESCIVALADVFDALVSKRPYKTAFPDDKAYDIITKDSGSHFDPDVVNAFVDNYNKFISIHAQYTD